VERALRLLDGVDDLVTAVCMGCRAHWPARRPAAPLAAAFLAAVALLAILA